MSVRKAIAWSFAGQIASFAASFATMVALARLLTPREVGIYAVGLAVTGVLQAISAFGVGTYLVREEELHPQTIATGFTVNAIVQALLAGAILLASALPAVTGGEPMVSAVLRLLAIVPLIGILEFLPATMLQRRMRFQAISVIAVVRTVGNAVVSIAAAFLGASALSAAYGGIAYAVIGVVAFWIVARGDVGFSLSLRGSGAMAVFGLRTLSIGGVSALVTRLSDVLLGRLLGLTALGFYSRASTLGNVMFQNVYGSIARVMLVKLSDDRRAGRPLRVSYLVALENILGIMWPLLAGVAVLAAPAVAILFGERWMPAAVPLSLLMLVQLLALSFAMHHELFIMGDRIGQQAKLEVIRSLVGLAAFTYGCRYGLEGAAAGRLVDSLAGMALFLPLIPGLSGAGWRELAAAYARSGAVTLATIAPPAALMVAHDWRHDVAVLPIGAAVAAGGVCWLVALRLTHHPLWREIERFRSSRR